jgi:peptidoglycan/xylan/chitin deacetylase (PgdA/CDA1 family)
MLPRQELATRRVVLCYHSIHPSAHYASASPAMFADHLDWLRDTTDVVALTSLLDDADPSRMSGRPRVAISFDDGYADNHEYALPMLAERGMTATFFVTVGFLERADDVMPHLAEIWRTPRGELAPLSWAQVEEMRAAGMAFGSHTWSHPNLAELPAALAAVELRRSKEVMEDRTGVAVTAIAYPFGQPAHHVNDETISLAAAAGYEQGYVSLPRSVAARDEQLRIPRFGVGDDTVDTLAAKVRGDIDWHALVHEHLPRRLSRALFPVYP